jgi:hypothetical protein
MFTRSDPVLSQRKCFMSIQKVLLVLFVLSNFSFVVGCGKESSSSLSTPVPTPEVQAENQESIDKPSAKFCKKLRKDQKSILLIPLVTRFLYESALDNGDKDEACRILENQMSKVMKTLGPYVQVGKQNFSCSRHTSIADQEKTPGDVETNKTVKKTMGRLLDWINDLKKKGDCQQTLKL